MNDVISERVSVSHSERFTMSAYGMRESFVEFSRIRS